MMKTTLDNVYAICDIIIRGRGFYHEERPLPRLTERRFFCHEKSSLPCKGCKPFRMIPVGENMGALTFGGAYIIIIG